MNLTVIGGKGIIILGISLAVDWERKGLAWFYLLTKVNKDIPPAVAPLWAVSISCHAVNRTCCFKWPPGMRAWGSDPSQLAVQNQGTDGHSRHKWYRDPSRVQPQSLWWLILFVNLTGSKIAQETNLRAHLWGLIGVNKTHLNIGRTIPWARVLDYNTGESELGTSILPAFLSDCGCHVMGSLVLLPPCFPCSNCNK